jgi:hypothetical protein
VCVCVNIFLCLFCKNFFLLHCTFERIMYVQTCTWAAFDLALVCSTAAPHHSHALLHIYVRKSTFTFEYRAFLTHRTRHECGRTYLCTFERTLAEPFQDLFLGHFFSILPHFIVALYNVLPLISISSPPKHPNPPHPPPPITNPPPPSHRRPLSTIITHRRPPLPPISRFSPQKPENPFLQNLQFFFVFFCSFWAQIHSWIVPLAVGVGFV